MPPHFSLQLSHLLASRNVFRITALTQEEIQTTEQSELEEEETNAEQQPKDSTRQKPENEEKSPSNRTKLYVGNLPRSCDSAQLTHLFQEFGTVESAEVFLIYITVCEPIHTHIYVCLFTLLFFRVFRDLLGL
jgi:RNA recognition motif-containing protein